MPDLFKEIIPSILQTKDHCISSEEDEKSYTPYIVNKAISSHIDALYFVSEMNYNHHLDKKLQYDYLFHSIRGYKRKFQKWVKYTEPSEIELIKEYYGYSSQKAKQILSLLSQQDIEYMKEKLNKGGKCK